MVSEGLANITKHAQASQAEVFVQRAGDRLHIIVSDDGVGGADPARGTGLAGLAKRAGSVDGTFDVASPPGGPTLITVDLPCAVTGPGRWIWVLAGLLTAAALVIPGTRLIDSA